MAPPVKRRRYDSSRRRDQARETRRVVLAAAHEQFLREGYAATTVATVATAAGVSVETVYKAFGNKPGLVKAVFDVAIAGDDEPVPIMERDMVQRNIAEPDPRVKLADYARFVAEVAPRVGPIQFLIREAAASDTGAAAVWAEMQEERLFGMAMFAQHLAEGGHLRDGVSADEARDVLWVHNSVELWELLVRQRGWSDERYGEWIGHQLVAALL
jgi:AcrR family transcriptional regulator